VSADLGPARLLGLAIGFTCLVLGLVILASGGVVVGWYLLIAGAVLVIALLLERTRYRSDAADRRGEPVGPAGGEPSGTRLEPRFSRSEEVFADPTTGRRMRVWVDPATGERRYLAED
jgi:hypothetical protein